MTDIAPIGRPNPTAYAAVDRISRNEVTSSSMTRGTDRAEFSDAARYLSRLRELPVRQELVDRVRSEIAAGTYDTPDKVDALLDNLMSDMSDL